MMINDEGVVMDYDDDDDDDCDDDGEDGDGYCEGDVGL